MTRSAFKGSTYRCQGKASYASLEALGFVIGLLGGGASAVGGRWYRVEASLPYDGRFSFACRINLSHRVHESRLTGCSPRLQGELLDSCMDLRLEVPGKPSARSLEKALLPLVGAIAEVEIAVVAGRTISMRGRRAAGWEIPEDTVDALDVTTMTEETRLKDSLAEIGASPSLAAVDRS